MYDQTNRKPGLERITEKEMEEKVRKQGYTMTFPRGGGLPYETDGDARRLA